MASGCIPITLRPQAKGNFPIRGKAIPEETAFADALIFHSVKFDAESLHMKNSDLTVPAIPTVQVIERIFTLIEILADHEEAVSLKEISEKSGLHPSTAHRILNDLAIGRLVDRPIAGNYRLGMRFLELGNLVKARLNVRDAAPVSYTHLR